MFNRKRNDGQQEKRNGFFASFILLDAWRSFWSNNKAGADTIRAGVGGIAEETRKALEPGRIETFEMAMQRMNVEERMLPIIHNQLATQTYFSFFVGILGMAVGIGYVFNRDVAPWLALLNIGLAISIGLACLANSVQSSLRTMKIRKRNLMVWSQWLSSPLEWMPPRMSGTVPRVTGDMIYSVEACASMARKTRRQFHVAAFMFVTSLTMYLLAKVFGWSGLHVFPLLIGAVQAAFAMRNSFELFQQRHRFYCDMAYWLAHAGEIYPSVRDLSKAANDPIVNAPTERRRV